MFPLYICMHPSKFLSYYTPFQYSLFPMYFSSHNRKDSNGESIVGKEEEYIMGRIMNGRV